MEKLEKEKKFDELLQKFKYFDDHVNNLADAMMYVAIADTPDADRKQDILTGLALARLELQEMFELREDYTKLNDVSDSEIKMPTVTDTPTDAHQLQQQITDANIRFGEILNVLCSREVIDDGITLDWMRKSIADTRMLLDRLTNDSPTDWYKNCTEVYTFVQF